MKEPTLHTNALQQGLEKLIAEKKIIPPPPPEPEPKKESKPVATRKMATKKAPKPPPPAHAKIVRNWKTEDKALDFELSFDDVGDPKVDVFDADNDVPVEMAADVDGLDEVIEILKTIRAAAVRIKSGTILPEDTAEPVDDDAEEEDDDSEEEENDDDAEEEEDDDEE